MLKNTVYLVPFLILLIYVLLLEINGVEFQTFHGYVARELLKDLEFVLFKHKVFYCFF